MYIIGKLLLVCGILFSGYQLMFCQKHIDNFETGMDVLWKYNHPDLHELRPTNIRQIVACCTLFSLFFLFNKNFLTMLSLQALALLVLIQAFNTNFKNIDNFENFMFQVSAFAGAFFVIYSDKGNYSEKKPKQKKE